MPPGPPSATPPAGGPAAPWGPSATPPAWDPTAPGAYGAQPAWDPTAQGAYGAQPAWDPTAQGAYGTHPAWDPAARGPSAGQPAWDPAAPGPYGTQPGWGAPPSPPPPGWGPPGGPQPGGGYPGPTPYPGQHWGYATGWYPPGVDPADPLVTPPGAGIGGWFERCVGAVRRGWRVLLPLLLVTQVLPAVVLSVLTLGVDPTARWEVSTAQDPAALPENFFQDMVTVLLVSIGGSVLIGLVQCVGWAAGTWVMARQAAGQPADLGSALRYGLRRALGLWGWTLLMGVIIGLGICFCVLPGIYLAFALSLAGPVYLFERQNPIGRAFGMFHQRFGMVLGRVALVAGIAIVGGAVFGAVQGALTAPFGTDPLGAAGTAVGVVAVLAVTGLLALPLQVVPLVGLVVTYAEQRAHEGPVNSAGLVAELG
ncbi:hypothetical protein D7I43_17580 [Micromonospora globbae]|uniref:Glycerophosphoryl diester phosphodiesterase membrane domain-containing protein n=1 Tax=Micromonospora globbae TaxID=1894969 RepID=A0A420EZD0_9ACTN|nr:hypothetical protein D7I43_17580 [Micromonospora globbae]